MFLGIPWLEWIGYSGSVIVAVSLTMSSIKKLRWYNLAGAVVFTVYGLFIGAYPVAFLNLFIVFTDIYYLLKIYLNKETFKSVVISMKDQYLDYFLKFHQADIQRFFPTFNKKVIASGEHVTAILLLRNADVAGVFIGEQKNDVFHVYLDYVTVPYRDLKPGDYLYNQNISFFKNNEISRIETTCNSTFHQNYLLKMGFKPSESIPTVYTKIV